MSQLVRYDFNCGKEPFVIDNTEVIRGANVTKCRAKQHISIRF